MKLAVFDTHHFERDYFDRANIKFSHTLQFLDVRLNENTACLASGFEAVCPFVNDRLNAATLATLHDVGVTLIALRSAGFNNVDLGVATQLGFRVVRVPEYSPYAVAEHAVGLILSLNRKIHRAYVRVREGNFSLDGLVGFDLHGKTVGIVGTGRIGAVMAKIMSGFGCKILAYDLHANDALVENFDVHYVPLNQLIRESDIISLHIPLNPETRHLMNRKAFAQMKKGVMLINTGRGALIDTSALIASLKSGQLGFAGLDVYEEEEKVFFQDLSEQILQDDLLARLLTFPNVLVTSHQAFLTREALQKIAETTLQNVADFDSGKSLTHEVKPEQAMPSVMMKRHP